MSKVQSVCTPLIFAVGDVSGMLNPLTKMLTAIENYKLQPEDKVVFLGNYVEGGPNSNQVIDILKAFEKRHPGQVVFLRGPSDQRFIRSKATFMRDLHGANIVKSYRSNSSAPYSAYWTNKLDTKKIMEHRHWLNTLPFFFETNNFFFCSAGINPEKSLEDQSLGSLMFNSKAREFIDSKKKYGKIVVHGTHPVLGRVEIRGNRINLNSAVAETKVLSCIVLSDETPTFKQVINTSA